MVDVTNLVTTSGTYVVADLITYNGAKYSGLGTFGAWAIVVAYESQSEELNNVVIFRGYQSIASTTGAQNFTVGPFVTPISGDVNSKFLIFAGEGDIDIYGDYIKINNTLLKRNTADNGNNAFNSGITENGVLVHSKNPDCENNIGIDIHTYNIGTTSPMADQRIIKTKMNSANITLGTSQDMYFPSVFAFQTQLYEPRVCYYIDNITSKSDGTVVFKEGKFTGQINKNEDYVFDIWISNVGKTDSDANLETAELVQVNMKFAKPSEFSYVNGSTSMQNKAQGIGVGAKSNVTDVGGDDLGEYNASANMSVWRVGQNANVNSGGTLLPVTFNDNSKKVFIEFTGKVGNINSKNVDLLELLAFTASFKTPSGGEIKKEDAKKIVQCRALNTNASVNPGIGQFTVTNQNFAKTSIETKEHTADNALYTQIVNKPFNAKLVSLGDKTAGSTSKKDVVSYNENVSYKIYAIKTPDFKADSSDEEKEALCVNATRLDNTIITNGNFLTMPSNGIISLNGIKVAKASRNASFQIVAGDVGTERYSCSIDSFAIRPATFAFDNSTLFANNLIGGKSYNGTILKAISNSSELVESYNQTKGNIQHTNSTLFIPSNCTTLDENITTDFIVSNSEFVGGKSNVTLRYKNVGNITVTFTDSDWAKIDRDINSTETDCIAGSATNTPNDKGMVGCDIALEKDMTFVPKGFANTLVISNFLSGSFTYMDNNDSEMSALMDLTFKVVLDDDTTPAANYRKNCYAQDIEYTVGLINNNLAGWRNITGVFSQATEQIRFYQNETINVNNATLASSSDIFIEGGIGREQIKFGFNRETNKPQNPFRVFNVDFDIASVKDTNNVNGSGFTNGNSSNATFYYGRVKSAEPKYYDSLSKSITAQINYEVYCGAYCDAREYGIDASLKDRNYRDWYGNAKHNSLDFGSVGRFLTTGNIDPERRASDNISDGTEQNSFHYLGDDLPYNETIDMEAQSWLIHNAYKKNATLESFDVIFQSPGGGWVGEGRVNDDDKLGRVIDTKPSTNIRQKMDW
jgi:hypothetical protein